MKTRIARFGHFDSDESVTRKRRSQRRFLRARKLVSLLSLIAVLGATLVAAETAFDIATDGGDEAAAAHILTDENGQDDEPGQKDLTGLSITGNTVTWMWDETGWSGNNTGDACALYDTNGNGLADFAVCVTVEDDPATQAANSPRIYTCNDSRADRCAGDSLVQGPYGTTCSVVIADGQNGNPEPAFHDDDTDGDGDTQATCVVDLNDVGGGSSDLLNTCSYPSQQPNSDPSDCVFIPREAFVELVKDVDPDGELGTFDFVFDDGDPLTSDPAPSLTTSTEISEIVPVVDGEPYTIVETIPEDWELVSVECVDGNGNTVGSPITDGVSLTVPNLATYTCTFTNTPSGVELTLTKIVDGGPASASDWDLSAALQGGGTFDYPDGGGNTEAVEPGTYDLAEIADPDSPGTDFIDDYTAGAWECDGGILNGSELTLAAGDEVSCTITNTFVPDPGVDVVKELVSNDDEDGSGTVSVGDTLHYTITATNTGNTTETLNVSDDLTGDSTQCVDVAPGGTCVLETTYEVSQADVDAGVINNIGEVCIEGSDPEICDTDPEVVNPPQAPGIEVDKALVDDAGPDGNGDGDDEAGDVIHYTVTATNSGNTTEDITVTDSIGTPDSIQCLAVAPGGTCVLETSYTITQPDIDFGSVVNVGEGCIDGADPAICDDDTVTVPFDQTPGIEVDKALVDDAGPDGNGDGDDEAGDVIHYTVTATNSGNTTEDITVTDSIGTPDSIQCLAVAPGGTCVLETSYTITQPDIDFGSVVNVGEGCIDGADPAICDDDTVTVPLPQDPGVDVVKNLTSNDDEDGSGSVTVDDTLHYTITATNTGNTTETLVVSDDLTGDSVTCVDVAPGGTCVLETTYVVTQADVDAGEIVNVGEVCIEGTDICDEDPEVVEPPTDPGVEVDKVFTSNDDEDGSGSVTVDDTLHYTITATNTGNTTETLVVSDDLTGDSVTCVDVAPGGTCVLETTYVVTQADVDAGEIVNVGEVCIEGTDICDEDPEVVEPPTDPGVEVDKVFTSNDDEDGSGSVTVDDTLHYTITATNTGNTTETLVVSDDLTGDSVTCVDVAPGGTCVLETTYVVTQADVDAGEIVNVGEVCIEGTDICDEDPEVVPTAHFTGIKIVKKTVGGNGTFKFSSPDDEIGEFELTTVGGEASSDVFTVEIPDTYTVSEDVPSGWALTSADCEGADSDLDGNVLSIEVGDPSDPVTCTFTNTKKTAGLTIVKKTKGGAGTFEFTSPDSQIGDFSLTTTRAGDRGTDSETFEVDIPDTYTVTENVPKGWKLTNVDCVGSDEWSRDGDTLNVYVPDPTEGVVCTFTNKVQKVDVKIVKLTKGGDGTFGFASDKDKQIPAFELTTDKGMAMETFRVRPGKYAVSEISIPADWNLTGIECEGGEFIADLGKGTVMFDVAIGSDGVKCTFTNTYTPPPMECTEDSIEFGDYRLLNRDGDDRITIDYAVAPGEYRITLVSSDPLHEPGRQPEQMNEQWKLQFLDAAGNVVYETPITTDLPDADTMIVDFDIATGVQIPDGVVQLRAQHARIAANINSIIPDCAILTQTGGPVDPPPPPPPPPEPVCRAGAIGFDGYVLMDRAGRETYTVTAAVEPGIYAVSAVTGDPLHEPGKQPWQTTEQVTFQFLDAAGNVVAETMATDDVPTDDLSIYTELDRALEIPEGVTHIRAHHVLQGDINSVVAECLMLDLLQKTDPIPEPVEVTNPAPEAEAKESDAIPEPATPVDQPDPTEEPEPVLPEDEIAEAGEEEVVEPPAEAAPEAEVAEEAPAADEAGETPGGEPPAEVTVVEEAPPAEAEVVVEEAPAEAPAETPAEASTEAPAEAPAEGAEA